MARLSFFQFLHSNMGSSLLELISFDGWPPKEDWVKWEAWWDENQTHVTQQMTRKGEKGLSTDWQFKVKRISSLIVAAVDEFVVIAVENHTQWSNEKWIWRVNMIRNALTELKILPWPIQGKNNWFTRIENSGKSLIFYPFLTKKPYKIPFFSF